MCCRGVCRSCGTEVQQGSRKGSVRETNVREDVVGGSGGEEGRDGGRAVGHGYD